MNVLCDVRNQVGESPVWSVAEQALYWVDIEARRVHRYDWTTRRERSWLVAERVGCIALHADGGLLAAMETGLFHLRLGEAERAEALCVQPVRFPRSGMRFNDGRCDREGRLWVSSMVMDMGLADASGALYRYDGTELRTLIASGLLTGNGLGFSADGQVAYLSDSHPQARQIWRLDPRAARIEREPFVDMRRLPGRPDGAAVDAQGNYWTCANDAGLLHCFAPSGRLEYSVSVPTPKPSMCAFGGPDLAHLFVTSITPAAPVDGYDATMAGAVFVMEMDGVHGLAEVPFNPAFVSSTPGSH